MEKDTALSLYRSMLRIRMVEEKIAGLYPEQQMRCPVHLCIGQEAVAAGVCTALTHQDYIMSNHRSHGHYLAKGGDLKAMMAELYGRKTGCTNGRGGSMHLLDLDAGFLGATPIVGSTIPIATGVAMASKMRRERRVTAVFFGDAAVEEGVFHESLNFAVLKKLPVIYVCENNLYSVNSPLSVRQPPDRSIHQLACAYGMNARRADGNDVTKVYMLAAEAIERARRGQGPSFLEFSTYRWREHCGPYYDHELGFRPVEEFRHWVNRCPVAGFRATLLEDGLADEGTLGAIESEISGEIDRAVSFAQASLFPEPETLFANIYAS